MTTASSGSASAAYGPRRLKLLWRRMGEWTRGDSVRHRRQQLAVAFLIYAGLSLAAYWPIYPGDPSRVPTQASGDIVQDIWFLTWTPYALIHGLNPFYTHLINVPYGVNTAQNTQMPLLGVLSAPLTWLVSPVATYNLLLWLAIGLSALSAAYVVRRWTSWFPAAFIAGLLYGFGPYLVGEGLGHLNLTFVVFPPLIVMAAYELFVVGGRAVYWGCVLALFLVAQFYISPEIMVSSVLVTAVSLVVLAVLRWPSVPSRLRLALPGVAAAIVLTGACTAVAIWFEVVGPNHYSGPVQGYGNIYHADLLGVVLPTKGLLLYPESWKTAGTALLNQNWDENGSYLGVPLLVVSGALAIRFFRDRWLAFAALMVPVAYLISMGQQLTINDKNTSVFLPFNLVAKLPVFENLLTSRMSVYVMLAMAFVVGRGLADWNEARKLRSARHRRAGGLLFSVAGAISVASLVPAWPYATYPLGLPAGLLDKTVPSIGRGTTVLAYPYPTPQSDEAMLWQALSGMRFNLVGGYALTASSTGGATAYPALLEPPIVQLTLTYLGTGAYAPLAAPPSPAEASPDAVREYLNVNDIGAIVVDLAAPNTASIILAISAAVGPPTLSGAGEDLWLRRASPNRRAW